MSMHMCVADVHARVEASDRRAAIPFSAVGHFVGCVTALDTHTGCVSMLRFFRVLPCIHTCSAAAAEAACSRRNISQYPLGGAARPSVWGQILQRASEDQEKLREIVRDLKIHCDQVHCAPPLDVFNELLRLCNYWHDGESMHKLLGLMTARNMQVDKYTFMHLNEGFSYFPRAFPDPGAPIRSSAGSSSSSSHVHTSMPSMSPHQLHQQTPVQHHHGSTRHQTPHSSASGAHVQVSGRQQAGPATVSPMSQAGLPAADSAAAATAGSEEQQQQQQLRASQPAQQQQHQRHPSTGGT